MIQARCLPLVAIAMLSGCYIYRPLATVDPPAGTRVAVALTEYGADTLARYVGPGITTLRGDVVTAESAGVILAVTSVTDRFGREQTWRGEQVLVPRPTVRSVQRSRFSLGRSLLLGVGILGGSVAAWRGFRGGIGGGGPPSGGGGSRPK